MYFARIARPSCTGQRDRNGRLIVLIIGERIHTLADSIDRRLGVRL